MNIHKFITDWTDSINLLSEYYFIYSVDSNADIQQSDRVLLSAEVVFIDNSKLFINEFIDYSKNYPNRLSYSYHCQNVLNSLILRYDNAPHKPNLGYVNHKHLNDGTIIQSDLPMINKIVSEIAILQNLS